MIYLHEKTTKIISVIIHARRAVECIQQPWIGKLVFLHTQGVAEAEKY